MITTGCANGLVINRQQTSFKQKMIQLNDVYIPHQAYMR